jgi:oligopeptide/dipeptide ABC transporter ATP-binding protein
MDSTWLADADTDVLIRVRALSKWFELPRSVLDGLRGRPRHRIHAVNGVSLTLRRGQTLGLVGESGCGKSTLARCLVGLLPPDEGQILYEDIDLAALDGAGWQPYRRRLQMVFQDPFSSLNPRQRIRDALAEVLAVHRLAEPGQRGRRVSELLQQVGLAAADATKFPGEFSGGQRQRIAIARALAVRPEVLVADEPLSALDVSIQAQILRLLLELRNRLRLTMLFVSHDLRTVRYVSDSVAVMYLGRIVEYGPAAAIFERPRHPYTQALLASVPGAGAAGARLSGEPPSAIHPPQGCPFHPRCPFRVQRCMAEAPLLRDLGDGQMAACHLAEPDAIAVG